MMCPGTNTDCDNPGCRRGGCPGRLPPLPLFRLVQPALKPPAALFAEAPVPVGRAHVMGSRSGG